MKRFDVFCNSSKPLLQSVFYCIKCSSIRLEISINRVFLQEHYYSCAVKRRICICWHVPNWYFIYFFEKCYWLRPTAVPSERVNLHITNVCIEELMEWWRKLFSEMIDGTSFYSVRSCYEKNIFYIIYVKRLLRARISYELWMTILEIYYLHFQD